MEKILFKKLEVWIVLLLVVVMFVGTMLFGAVVRNAAIGYDKFGALGRFALALANVPRTAKEVLSPDRAMVAFTRENFAGRSGWRFPEPTGAALDGYLLISRYDGDAGRHVVELFDISTKKVVFTWRPDADQLLAGARRQSSVINFSRWDTQHYRAIHPLLLDDGGLIIKDHQTPLIRINSCGKLVWRQEGSFFHHTTEIDKNGALLVPGRIEPSVIDRAPDKFRDDTIVKVSADGEILEQRSIGRIFKANGLGGLLFGEGAYQNDPTHLNDIQPVVSDGPYWKLGDLFLSFRHLSMIALYRPSTDRIVWFRIGPWSAQHDVDIVNDHTIAVFNNNTFRMLPEAMGGRGWVDGTNEIVFYDFANDAVTTPYKGFFENEDIRTVAEGLFGILPDGYVFVEEENAGRILLMQPTGKLAGEFINRASDGRVYRLGWSRYVDRANGERALKSIRSADCAVDD